MRLAASERVHPARVTRCALAQTSGVALPLTTQCRNARRAPSEPRDAKVKSTCAAVKFQSDRSEHEASRRQFKPLSIRFYTMYAPSDGKTVVVKPVRRVALRPVQVMDAASKAGCLCDVQDAALFDLPRDATHRRDPDASNCDARMN